MPVIVPKDGLESLGNYDLLEKIAAVGVGSVYRGRRRATAELVAVKVMPPFRAGNELALQRFARECRILSGLNDPNIVRALDFGIEGNIPYLVMEFVDGESLGERIDREGCLPEAEAVHVIAQIARALDRAHCQGLVHRHVKPDNILLTAGGDVKLADLGLAKHVETSTQLTKTGGCLGTPNFMAPEQFRDARCVDKRCDIYALAATLYMAVTGQLPFAASNLVDCCLRKFKNDLPPPRELNPDLSERVDWAIRRAMSADPAARPASCVEFVEDLTGRSEKVPGVPKRAARADSWYVVYEDASGTSQQTSGPQQDIRRSLQEGLLGDAEKVRVSASQNGPFEPLRSLAEFRDLVVALPARPNAETEPVDQATPSPTACPTGDARETPAWLPAILAVLLGLAGFLVGLYLLAR
ncbi:MAG: serine/threonine protein kinase [Gemmataceae bacterium]|nr:serine/threonine protein kinase [Gemmataceae bacterium]